MNVLLDELLTHLRREDAVDLVNAMLPGWGAEPDLVLYWGPTCQCRVRHGPREI